MEIEYDEKIEMQFPQSLIATPILTEVTFDFNPGVSLHWDGEAEIPSQFALGFELSQSPQFDEITDLPSNQGSTYFYTEVSDLPKGITYYYRAYLRYLDTTFYSPVNSLTIL